jgi:hypothetical protein
MVGKNYEHLPLDRPGSNTARWTNVTFLNEKQSTRSVLFFLCSCWPTSALLDNFFRDIAWH